MAPYAGPELVFTIRGTPVSGKNSPRLGTTGDGRPIRRKSKAAETWLANAVMALAGQMRTAPMIRGRCRVTIHAVHSLALTGWDVDNVANLALDACKKALVFRDDCAAIVREIELLTDENKTAPQVTITIGPCHRTYDAHGRML